MAKTRHYFADAAIQGCFDNLKENYEGQDLFMESVAILGNLNTALMIIVERFIVKRGYIFKVKHDEE